MTVNPCVEVFNDTVKSAKSLEYLRLQMPNWLLLSKKDFCLWMDGVVQIETLKSLVLEDADTFVETLPEHILKMTNLEELALVAKKGTYGTEIGVLRNIAHNNTKIRSLALHRTNFGKDTMMFVSEMIATDKLDYLELYPALNEKWTDKSQRTAFYGALRKTSTLKTLKFLYGEELDWKTFAEKKNADGCFWSFE